VKTTTKQLKQSLLFSAIAIAFVACGGGNLINKIVNPPQVPPPPAQNAHLFMGGIVAGTSLQPTAAASTTPQSFFGLCSIPADPGKPYQPFGLGNFDSFSCNIAPTHFLNFGPPIVDDGTLGNLVVVSATNASNPSGATLTVYVGRGTVQGTPTAITCTIPQGQTACKDRVNTAAVTDGQWVAVLVQNGDGLSALQVVFSKS